MKNINFINFEELPSTNTYALTNIDNLSDKTVIVANIQKRGKGRLGRVWISDNPENLYFTIVLKSPKNLKVKLPFVNPTQYMAVIICETLESYGVKPQIKWPNDVLVDGKKISGILAEAFIKADDLPRIVLGVGVNLNSTPEEIEKIDQKATSLNLELNKKIDKKLFLDKLLENFFEKYDEFLLQGFPLIKEDYIQRSPFIGKEVTISSLNSNFNAVAESILDDGSLRIKIGDEFKNLNAGDLTLI